MFTPVSRNESEWEGSVWDYVSHTLLDSLWNLQGVTVKMLAKRVWNSMWEDNLFGRSAQLAYYFLFALFPMLISASALLGLAARSATSIYVKLLNTVAGLMPPAAFGVVVETFNQTTSASTRGKVTLGLVIGLWSASVGISAVQDTMNAVYKVKETRSYWRARLEAIILTIGSFVVFTMAMASLLGSNIVATMAEHTLRGGKAIGWVSRTTGWIAAVALISFMFALIYYWSPDIQNRKWRWLTPGGLIGIGGWVLGSLALRVYLHFFNNYSVTYGSLGAVVILLMWFYITGLMLLLGAEVNSEIEGAVSEARWIAERENNADTD
jgi:membrane protein